MKIITKFLLSFSFVLFGFFFSIFFRTELAHAAFAGGDGSVMYPYRITNCTQLQDIRNDVDANYVMTDNVDCTEAASFNGGLGFEPLYLSGGSFDGRNNIISNVTINRTGYTNLGLFYFVLSSTIENVKLQNVSVTGETYVASLAGYVSQSTITNVSSIGTVTGSNMVSGLVSEFYDGNISRCSFVGDVTATSYFSSSAGLILKISNAHVSDCYVNADIVAGTNFTNGTIFDANSSGTPSSILRTYNTGTLINNNYNNGFLYQLRGDTFTVADNLVTIHILHEDGAFFGAAPSVSTLDMHNNYFDSYQMGYDYTTYWTTVLEGVTNVSGELEGVPTYPFKNTSAIEPFLSWDFANVWQVTSEYPILRDGPLDVLASLPLPGKPTDLSATTTTSSIDLSWTAPAPNMGSAVSSYKAEYKLSSDSTWTEYSTTETHYEFTGLAASTSYDFRVAAVSSEGTGETEVATYWTMGIPIAPTNLTITKRTDSPIAVDISWTLSVYDGGIPITNYDIKIKNHSDLNWDSQISVSSTGSSDNTYWGFESGLIYGNEYDFRVRAYNGTNYSDFSSTVSYLVPEIPTLHIKTCEDLQGINDLIDHDGWVVTYSTIILDNDIPCEISSTWNPIMGDEGNSGFDPIYYLNGTFDGQGFTISGLYMNYPEDNSIGLFEGMGNSTIQDIKFTNANITGFEDVGLLSGYVEEDYTVSLSNIDVTNSTVDGSTNVGGLIGSVYYGNSVEIAYVNFTGEVVGIDYLDDVDGLVATTNTGGYIGRSYEGNDVFIDSSSMSGSVTGSFSTGGFVGYSGYSYLTITSSSSTAEVEGEVCLGGFVGYLENSDNYAHIRDSTFTGNIIGRNTEVYMFFGGGAVAAGGLIGYTNLGEVEIENTTVTGDINGGFGIGGLIGYSQAYTSILNSTFSGDITGIQEFNDPDNMRGSIGVGGLLGLVDGYGTLNIEDSSSSGNVSGTQYTGGLIGMATGLDSITISSSSSSMNVNGVLSLGGLLGNSNSPVYINDSHSSGKVEGTGFALEPSFRVGGLIGYVQYAEIYNSYNEGNVSGEYRVGGLVGSSEEVYIYENSFNSGNITANYAGESTYSDFKGVGGLVGITWRTEIYDSFNLGDVDGTGALYVGGLVGAGGWNVDVQRSFNSGEVNGDISDHDFNAVGGLIGSAIDPSIYDSYNDGKISGKVRVGGLIGFGFRINMNNTYNTGDVTGVDTDGIGGLIGSNYIIINIDGNSSIYVSSSFNTGEVTSLNSIDFGTSNNGGVFGQISNEVDKTIVIDNNWWNNTLTNGIGAIDMVDPLASEITGQYQKAESKDVFKGSYSNQPLAYWDFENDWIVLCSAGIQPLGNGCGQNIWYSSADRYPILTYSKGEKPVITLLGSTPVNVSLGGTYTDAGATAWGSYSGDKTSKIVVSNPVNTSIAGTYTVTYNVEGIGRVPATEVTRTVVVGNAVTSTPAPTLVPSHTHTPTPTPTEPFVYILLNDFTEYLDGTGKLLSELVIGQEIVFNVDSERHTATIKEIGDIYVVVTLASTPFDITLSVGESRQADVTGDGINDVQVTLNSITNGKADLTFVELAKPVLTELPRTGPSVTPTTLPIVPSSNGTNNIISVILITVLVIMTLGVLYFLILGKKDKKEKKDNINRTGLE